MGLMEKVEESIAFLKDKIGDFVPKIGIILGTGLSPLADDIESDIVVPYGDIPHFPVSTVEGHKGNLMFGSLSGKDVVAMQGRVHYYEGYSMQDVTYPVRVMKILGVDALIVSNASGGLNKDFEKGDIMLITDHINLMGDNPLRGPNDERFGPRFPEMMEPYSYRLIKIARDVALECGIFVREGVYVALSGPNLETRAEYRFLSLIGADAVGQSTVPEVIVANHMGMEVLGISLVTNVSSWGHISPTTLDEIIEVGKVKSKEIGRIVRGVVERL